MLPEMNKTFSILRFGRLFKKHTKEHYRNYVMSVAVLVGVMLLGGGFLVYMADVELDKNLQTFFFFSIMLLAGTIFTSSGLCRFRGKEKSHCIAGFACIPL